MTAERNTRRRAWALLTGLIACLLAVTSTTAQQMVTETVDPAQTQDEDFAKLVKDWTGDPRFISPLVDHLPKVAGIPTPKDVLGYYIGAPGKLTYYADILKYYRALEKASPRVKVESIGRTDENREMVTVYVSSDENIRNLAENRANLAKLADPRGLSEAEIRTLINTTKPQYHLMGGLHSGETGPSEMLMELAYRLTTETSPLITGIRDNVIVSITPVAEPDGRDRTIDWFYRDQQTPATAPANAAPAAGSDNATNPSGGAAATPATPGGPPGGGGGGAQLPYWGKYAYHDNNRDFNVALMTMRSIFDWYMQAHPPIVHDLHESEWLMYTYSGNAPQNPNLDPILWFELPFFSNFEVAQMAKWGMPGVWTHNFMDGWSPGYLGSMAYNHNGMMRMYETQAGTEGRGGRGGGGRAGGAGTAEELGGAATAAASAAVQAAQAPASAPAGGGARGGRGARGGAPAGTNAPSATPAQASASGQAPGGAGRAGGGGARGGGTNAANPRFWYQGIPAPPQGTIQWSRRDNTNYMETGVLCGLQITSMFPNLILENFYTKTKNSIDAGRTQPPYGYVIPPARDMTRVATLVNLLRMQGIEVGQSSSEHKIGDLTVPAGSFVIKRDQPYGRLAKTMLEKQIFPDPSLQTYDDSGWTQGLAMLVDVKEVADKSILTVDAPLITTLDLKGKVVGSGSAGLAVAHYGSNNMIAFRYQLKNVPMKIAEKSFAVAGTDFPAGSFVIASPADLAAVRAAVTSLGLTAAAFDTTPDVPTHDADVPRIAIYSAWSNTQELGWYRFTFDKFGIPYDLIFKEQVRQGNLRDKYDVILMAAQQLGRSQVLAAPAARPVPYVKSDKYQFLGMYGESPDISGGMGEAGVAEFQKFLEGGGTLIATNTAVSFPIEFGFAHTVDGSDRTTSQFYAPRPIVQTEIVHPEHPVFYGYSDTKLPVKYLGGPLLRVGIPDQGHVLAKYVGGADAVLSGFMRSPDEISQRPYAVDIPEAYRGKGRVILFANNPIYRWQNHGEFNLVFNSILNWNDLPR
jgi:hypothetical protein